jgi:hypothetical protein
MANTEIVTFGKFRDKPVEALVQDAQYCKWLLTQSWFQEKFPNIHTLVINNFGAPSETPEHNALQALFLDEKWIKAFVVAGLGGAGEAESRFQEHRREQVDDLGKERQAQVDDYYRLAQYAHRNHIVANGSYTFDRAEVQAKCERLVASKIRVWEAATWQGDLCINDLEFEDCGTDVSFWTSIWARIGRWADSTWKVECKPALGDDYPAVLRQMMRRQDNVLLVGEGGYCGRGATFEQVTKIFAKSHIRIVCLGEVEAALESL